MYGRVKRQQDFRMLSESLVQQSKGRSAISRCNSRSGRSSSTLHPAKTGRRYSILAPFYPTALANDSEQDRVPIRIIDALEHQQLPTQL
jgi:hypothetical protein